MSPAKSKTSKSGSGTSPKTKPKAKAAPEAARAAAGRALPGKGPIQKAPQRVRPEHPWKNPRYVIWECTREYDDVNIFSQPHKAPPGPSRQIATDQAVAFLDNVARSGPTIVIFSGGEPLLRKDIFELARYAKTKGLKVILNTQGHLFDAKAARECVMAGIKSIQVGLDGSSSRSHDGFRRSPGSFVKAIKGIELMRLAGLRFEVNTYVNRENVEEIPKIQSLAQKLGAKGHNVTFVIPTGRFAAFKGTEIVGEEYEAWMQRLFEQKYRQKMNMKVICQPQFHRVIYQRGEELSDLQDPNRAPEAAEALGPGCPGAKLFCYVSSDGEVFPCQYLTQSVGNTKEREFRDIWDDSPLFDDFRDPERLKPKCGGCSHATKCGGCRALAAAATGNPMSEDPNCLYTDG